MPKVKGTPEVRFILQSTKEPKKPSYVFAYFVYNGKRLKYSTGLKVCPEAWRKGKAVASAKYPENTDVNLRLDKLKSFTIQVYRETEGNIEPIEFRKELDYRMGYAKRPGNEQAKTPTLLEFVEIGLREREAQPNIKESTLQAVRKIQKHLQNYSTDKGKVLRFEDITKAFFHDFKAWLFAPPRNLQTNYVHKLFGLLRMFMRDAKRRGLHNSEAFEDFKIKKEETTKIALTFDELETLFTLDLSKDSRLERVRDLFLIGAYSGLRFSDFSRLQPEHIVLIDGVKMIEITTQKTGEKVFIPLYNHLESLLQKYEFRVPKISGQKMNDYLKELGQLGGLTEKLLVKSSAGGKRLETEMEKWQKLTTHVARRSFATNFYIKGMPAYQIMKITGHRTENSFRQYICIDARLAASEFAKEAIKILSARETK